VLGLIEAKGNRKWGVSVEGKNALDEWPIILPEVVDSFDENEQEVEIPQLLPPSNSVHG
jgi:hypothetical protein